MFRSISLSLSFDKMKNLNEVVVVKFVWLSSNQKGFALKILQSTRG